MRRVYFWLISIIFIALVYIILKSFNINHENSVLIAGLLYFSLSMLLNIVSNIILVSLIEKFNQGGDARKLLNFIISLERITFSDTYMQSLLINKSAAFYGLGDYDKALENLSFELNYKLSPIMKTLYYINLSATYIKLGNLNDSQIYLEQAIENYQHLKRNKYSNEFNNCILLNRAEVKIMKGEDDSELDNLLSDILAIKSNYLRTNVETNLILAKIYLLKKQYPNAKKYFDFAILNSNKLYENRVLENSIIENGIIPNEIEGYIDAHYYCSNNKPFLLDDKVCGCFHCLTIFDPKEIERWLDEQEGTAICPYCGIDSVIGESSEYPITKEFLEKMNKHWFN